jgi:hypothetical protein
MICVHIHELFTREASLLKKKEEEEQVELWEYLLTFGLESMSSLMAFKHIKERRRRRRKYIYSCNCACFVKIGSLN